MHLLSLKEALTNKEGRKREMFVSWQSVDLACAMYSQLCTLVFHNDFASKPTKLPRVWGIHQIKTSIYIDIYRHHLKASHTIDSLRQEPKGPNTEAAIYLQYATKRSRVFETVTIEDRRRKRRKYDPRENRSQKSRQPEKEQKGKQIKKNKTQKGFGI